VIALVLAVLPDPFLAEVVYVISRRFPTFSDIAQVAGVVTFGKLQTRTCTTALVRHGIKLGSPPFSVQAVSSPSMASMRISETPLSLSLARAVIEDVCGAAR